MSDVARKDRYENEILIGLHALLADAEDLRRKNLITPTLKRLYRDLWEYLIEHGLKLRYSPELSALIFAVLFYQDVIAHKLNDDVLAEIRRCIRENEHDPARLPRILLRLEMTTIVADAWARGNRISADDFALAVRDIHRVVFDDNDATLEATLAYFIEGVERIHSGLTSIGR